MIVKNLVRLVMGRRLPTWRGTMRLAGPEARLCIRRDGFGVAYVDAETDADAWFGLGFCHGQDRGGQLEIMRRLAHGTLSAVAGPDTLGLDRLSRRLGIRQAGEAQYAASDQDVRDQLDAYSSGVNAGLARGGRKLPHELALLRTRPSVWTGADSHSVAVLLTFALAANWEAELTRLAVLRAHGAEGLAAVDTPTPEWLVATSPPGAKGASATDHLQRDAELFRGFFGLGGGSNAWVLAGSKTATGRPLLASDPHLMPAAPAQWYLVRLRTPEWSAAGATFAGTAAVSVGHNGHAAWGVTAAHVDVTDLFVEELRTDGRSVRDGDGWLACPVRHEVIAVKGRPPVIEDVLITPRGPIVTPAFTTDETALSMSATWLAPRRHRGLYSLHKARSIDDFRAVARHAPALDACLVWALSDGTIGWQVATEVPVRRLGSGTVPMAGGDPRTGWDGLVPPEQLPFATDPQSGFFVTANNAPTADPDGPFLGVDWLDGYRATVITEALERSDDWDVEACLRLQTDTRSLPWEEMREVVLGAPRDDPAATRALEHLERWDGELGADSVGGSVYVFFVCEMMRRMVVASAPAAAAEALGRGASELIPYNLSITRRLSHLSRHLTRQTPRYFAERGWPAEIGDALATAWRQLETRFGRTPARWAWGRIRPLTLVHPFGDKKPLSALFNVKGRRCGGDASTVAQGAVDLRDPAANPVGVPTLRTVFDVGEWDACRFVLLGGQSGNPLSPHYADQVPLWERGETLPIYWSDERRDEVVEHTLILEPSER